MSPIAATVEWFLENVVMVRNLLIVLPFLLIALAALWWRHPKIGFIAAYNIFASIVLLELLLVLPLRLPSLMHVVPRGLLGVYRQNYMNYWRAFFPAQYDPELSLVLHHEPFRFRNPEFDTTVEGNSAGVRDDEESLSSPSILVLGDSHAMGWGVEQEETFAYHLEQESGLRVLNAGINGYGTAREALLWKRLSPQGLHYVVIQYCDNDEPENATFRQLGRLPITSQADRERLQAEYETQKRYIPGKIPIITLARFVRDIKRAIQHGILGTQLPRAISPEEEAEEFIHALMQAPLEDQMQLIVLESNGFNLNDGAFVRALERVARSPLYPLAIRSLRTLDTSAFLTNDDYFILDDHLNRRGHEKIAREIQHLIGSDLQAIQVDVSTVVPAKQL